MCVRAMYMFYYRRHSTKRVWLISCIVCVELNTCPTFSRFIRSLGHSSCTLEVIKEELEINTLHIIWGEVNVI